MYKLYRQRDILSDTRTKRVNQRTRSGAIAVEAVVEVARHNNILFFRKSGPSSGDVVEPHS